MCGYFFSSSQWRRSHHPERTASSPSPSKAWPSLFCPSSLHHPSCVFCHKQEMTEEEKISYIYCTHDLNFRPSLASYDDDDDASESSGIKVRYVAIDFQRFEWWSAFVRADVSIEQRKSLGWAALHEMLYSKLGHRRLIKKVRFIETVGSYFLGFAIVL